MRAIFVAVFLLSAVVAEQGLPWCQVCEAVVTKIQTTLENNTAIDAKIEGILEIDVCDRLPGSFGAICNSTVEAKTPEIINAIAMKLLDPTNDCKSLHLCTNKGIVRGDDNGVICNICHAAVNFIDQKVLESNTTQAKAETALETICSAFPTKYQAACDAAIVAATPKIMNTIGQYLENSGCEAIHACSQKEEALPICPLCEAVVGKLQSVLENNTSVDAKIEAILEKEICDRLPAFGAACNATIEAKTPDVINALAVKLLDPTTDCTALHACSQQTYARGDENGVICDICHAAVNFIDQKVLESNTTQAKAETALETICSAFPTKYQAACDAAIVAATPKIMDTLGQYLENNGCEAIHACSTREEIQVVEVEAIPLCPLCEAVIGKLESVLQNNTALDTKIEGILETQVCDRLGGLGALCNTTVEAEVPSILNTLAAKLLDPTTDCTALKLCSSEDAPVAVGLADGLFCKACEAVVSFFDSKILENNSTQVKIETALDSICTKFPKMEAACEAAVAGAVPKVMDTLAQYLQNGGCQLIHACPTKKEEN